MTAHDVRHLTICERCEELGDKRRMIMSHDKYWHDHCAFLQFGNRILFLPESERAKFTIGGIPKSMMRRLIDSMEIEP